MISMQDLTFGVEVETVGRTRETVARAIQMVVGGTVAHVGHPACYDPWHVTAADGRVWKVVADSSLNDVPADLRAEVVTPILRYDDLPLLQEVIRTLRACGAKATPTCGLHCHVGAERFTGKTLANLVKIVHKQEELVFAAFGVSPERKAKYTKPFDRAFIQRLARARPQTLAQMQRLWYGRPHHTPTRYDPTRYCLVNLNAVFLPDRSTVEFRAYTPGGLHAGKIKAAIQFSLALCVKALNSRAASLTQRRYDPQTARYDFRVFLLHLGMIGDEFKTARKHLLALMPGDSAFKYGKVQRPKKPPITKTEEAAGAGAEVLRPSC